MVLLLKGTPEVFESFDLPVTSGFTLKKSNSIHYLPPCPSRFSSTGLVFKSKSIRAIRIGLLLPSSFLDLYGISQCLTSCSQRKHSKRKKRISVLWISVSFVRSCLRGIDNKKSTEWCGNTQQEEMVWEYTARGSTAHLCGSGVSQLVGGRE